MIYSIIFHQLNILKQISNQITKDAKTQFSIVLGQKPSASNSQEFYMILLRIIQTSIETMINLKGENMKNEKNLLSRERTAPFVRPFYKNSFCPIFSEMLIQSTLIVLQQFMNKTKISVGVLCLLSFLSVAMSQPNFQERIVYYSEQQNGCQGGLQTDSLQIHLKLGNFPLLKTSLWGGTHCAASAIHFRDILSVNDIYYFNNDLQDSILISQDLTKNYVRGVLVNMVARATVGNQCKLRGRPCSCKIIGDGIQQHFGNQYPGYPPASIYLDCKFADQSMQ